LVFTQITSPLREKPEISFRDETQRVPIDDFGAERLIGGAASCKPARPGGGTDELISDDNMR
jgi:hypothetical protein